MRCRVAGARAVCAASTTAFISACAAHRGEKLVARLTSAAIGAVFS
jgi:hypothetical protein